MTAKPRTRREILERLKADGAQTAATLAHGLGVTAMAVRQHLYELRDEGLVEESTEARPVGRPAKRWHLTEAANRYFPDAHAELAVGLIDAVRAALGTEAMERLIAERGRQQLASYRTALAGARTLRGRLAALARQRTAEGYMAHVESQADGYLLVENHCPICSAAKACTGLCTVELEVFAAALGPDVEIERTDHILAGARRCAYRVTPRTAAAEG